MTVEKIGAARSQFFIRRFLYRRQGFSFSIFRNNYNKMKRHGGPPASRKGPLHPVFWVTWFQIYFCF